MPLLRMPQRRCLAASRCRAYAHEDAALRHAARYVVVILLPSADAAFFARRFTSASYRHRHFFCCYATYHYGAVFKPDAAREATFACLFVLLLRCWFLRSAPSSFEARLLPRAAAMPGAGMAPAVRHCRHDATP